MSAADTPSYSVPPPVTPLVSLVLIILCDRFVPVPFLPFGLSLGIGIPLLVAGVGLWTGGLIGLLRRGESPMPGRTTGRLITAGAYRFSRNPLYAGETLGLLSLAVLLDTATGLAVAVLLGLGTEGVIRAEERYLEAKFGDEWREYRSRVRRWF